MAFADFDEGATHYHIGKVADVREGNIVVHNLATKGENIQSAKWAMLYDTPKGLTLTPAPHLRKTQNIVTDNIPTEDADGYIHHHNERQPATAQGWG